MEFILYCIDRADGGKGRQAARAAHLSFIQDKQHVFRYGGPLLAPDGSTKGSLLVLSLPDRAALDKYMRDDPYFSGEVFESVSVWQSRQVVPETSPGLLAAELSKQRADDLARHREVDGVTDH
jgi:uncharacterized protein YciI